MRKLFLISTSVLLGIICGLISIYFLHNIWLNIIFWVLIGFVIKFLTKRKLEVFFSEIFFILFLTISFLLLSFNSLENRVLVFVIFVIFLCIITIFCFFVSNLYISGIWEDLPNNFKRLNDNRLKNNLKVYYKKLKHIMRENEYNINPENELQINLKVGDPGVSDLIYKNIRKTKEFQIHLYNSGRLEQEEQKLNKKYQKALEKRGGIGMVGAPMPVLQFLNPFAYVITWELGKWVFKHILEDIDDATWNALKNIGKKIFISFKARGKKEDKITLVIGNDLGYKDLVFIFEKTLTLEKFEISFNKIDYLIKKLNPTILKKMAHFPLIFEYNDKEEKWEDRTKKYYDWFTDKLDI